MLIPREQKRLQMLAGGILLLLLTARSMNRSFDLDEHQFVAPPLLLLQQGQQPYADYPYFHMPNLIYVYAGALAHVEYKLLFARLISVVAGWLTIRRSSGPAGV